MVQEIDLSAENKDKKNLPKAVVIHYGDDFQDIFAEAVVDYINIILDPP